MLLIAVPPMCSTEEDYAMDTLFCMITLHKGCAGSCLWECTAFATTPCMSKPQTATHNDSRIGCQMYKLLHNMQGPGNYWQVLQQVSFPLKLLLSWALTLTCP